MKAKKFIYAVMALAAVAFSFTSCEDVPEPYSIPVSASGGNGEGSGGSGEAVAEGDGTLASPFNAIAANECAKKLASGEETASDVYIKGVISKVKEAFSTQFGNGTFYISEDGTTTNDFYVYRAYYIDNKKFADGDTQIEVGDTVIVCGKITNYNGTYETVQNKAYIYQLKKKDGATIGGGDEPGTEEPSTPGESTGDGSLNNPYNVAAVLAKTQALGADEKTTEDCYFKGKVVSITENYGTTFGNASFYVSDDGTSANQFLVWRANYLGNKKYASGDLLKEGDEVIICGKLVNFKGNTPETVQGEAYLYSLNGKTEGEETGGDEPGTEEPETPIEGEKATVSKAENIITITYDKATPSSETVTCNLGEYGWENATEPKVVTLSDGTTISFAQEGGNNAPKYYEASKGVRMYALNSMTITGTKAIAAVKLICDAYQGTNYVGNELLYTAVDGNTWKVVNDHTVNTGGVQLRVKTIEITYAQ
ncbi:MAG: hypothetical protein SPI57_06935 [Prevotella sp.]|nr:hypothetical protein [Prevotella sp.]MDY6092906.1 hypothetical protein [Prevotella sp.]